MNQPADQVSEIVERKLSEFELLDLYRKEELSPKYDDDKGPSLLHHVTPQIRDALSSEYQVVTQSWDQSGTDEL